jgi:prephenate dehydratase
MSIAKSEASNTNPEQAIQHRRVAIQGYPGSFHDIAARLFFEDGNIEVVPCNTFEDLLTKIEEGSTDCTGLMAIENSVAGSIMGNYRLLHKSELQATGEVYLRIKQNLMALPGTKISELKEVHSHPMAIAQCETFFRQHPHIRLIESEDTALSAKWIAENNLSNTGAIASKLASSIYGLELLAESIETNHRNYTRFLVLEKPSGFSSSPTIDKVSICFSLAHKIGSLHKLLSVLAAYELNLTKIQSTPMLGKEWEYFFFIDFLADSDVPWQHAIEAIRPLTHQLKVLGAYCQGKHHED